MSELHHAAFAPPLKSCGCCTLLWLALGLAVAARGEEPAATTSRPLDHDGYRQLIEQPFLPSDFGGEVFEQLWRRWPAEERSRAKAATPAERRQMAFSYYGLTPRPGGTSAEMPLQYTRDAAGGWAINCFACHGGKVAGQVMPGLPNSHFAFQSLSDDIRAIKLGRGEFTLRDAGWGVFPLGGSNGTTNAVMFGVAVLAPRDSELDIAPGLSIPRFTHHDVDAPPWWNVKKKQWLYCDGSTERDPRALMPFVLSSEFNDGERVRGWEDEFQTIYDWIMTLEAPKYPFDIDQELAARGETAFKRVCARCHGAYGPGGEYPELLVPIDEVATDRARLDALRPEHHRKYAESWLSHYGEKKVRERPGGYVAPPLDGIWASAPYFHNGSVPTLWHLLHVEQRPVVWRRSEDGYDQKRAGLEVEELAELPSVAKTSAQKRRYFDTRRFGKSAAGHEFPNELSDDEKRAVLEYLKKL